MIFGFDWMKEFKTLKLKKGMFYWIRLLWQIIRSILFTKPLKSLSEEIETPFMVFPDDGDPDIFVLKKDYVTKIVL